MNLSDSFDSKDELFRLNAEKTELLFPNIVVLSIYLLTAVTGNGLVIFVYSFRMKSKTDDRYFIPVLAVMDMAACFVGSSFAMVINTNQFTFQSGLSCSIFWGINKFTSVSSGLMLLVIAVHRYMKVCQPFKYQMNQTHRRLAIMIVACGSAFISVPSGFLYGAHKVEIKVGVNNITGYTCNVLPSVDTRIVVGYSVFLLLFCFGGIFAISVLYFMILRTIYKQESFWKRKKSVQMKQQETKSIDESSQYLKERNEIPEKDFESYDISVCEEHKEVQNSMQIISQGQEENGSKNRKNKYRQLIRKVIRKHKISIMFFLITILFCISYFPRIVLMIIESMNIEFWENLTDFQYSVCLFLYRGYLLNNVINPIVYSVFDTSFRKACKSICHKK